MPAHINLPVPPFEVLMKHIKELLPLTIFFAACIGSQPTEAGVIISNNAASTYDSNVGTLTFDLLWASTGADRTIQGYSFGLEHDTIGGAITSIADNSPALGGASPDFEDDKYYSNGGTIGVVYSFFNAVSQTVTTTPVTFARITVDTSGSTGDITFQFTNSLGSPPVASVYVEGGASVAMSMTPFTITDATNSGGGAVPEPSTAVAMGLLGVLGFAGNRRRRRQASAA